MSFKEFKDTVKKDIRDVFENQSEFAEKLKLEYDKQVFNSWGVIDRDTESDRTRKTFYAGKTAGDAGIGVNVCSVRLYIAYDKLPTPPLRGTKIRINGEKYTVDSIRREMGEYVIDLTLYDS